VNIHLTIAKENDLKTIAQLAHLIWNDHYVNIVGQEQVDYMLDKMYNLESLKEQLNEKKHTFYLIESDANVLGFISVSSVNQQDYFIHKFYINQQKSNLGIGSEVLNLLIQKITPKSLFLTVNRQNFKSINFYFKNHFKIDRVEDFDIGNNYKMNDFIMIRKL
jgi:ribosomal protein S18 acetylase RimI-like enzyme